MLSFLIQESGLIISFKVVTNLLQRDTVNRKIYQLIVYVVDVV